MAVSTQVKKVTAAGNDVATSFSFSPMVLYSSDQLVVTHVDSDGVETVLTEGVGTTNYAVVVSEYPGTGSITYPASGTANILATGDSLIIKRVLTLEQAMELANQGGYYPENQEDAFDKLTMIALQQQEEIDRALKLPISDSGDPEVPALSGNASKYLQVNTAETGFQLTAALDASAVSVTAFAETLLDDANAAAARTTLALEPAATGRATLGAAATTRTVQVFTASGTYTKPSGLKYAKIIVTGGGGAGGGVSGDAANRGGGGGGAGGTAIKLVSEALLAATETVTIGAAGAGGSSVGGNGGTSSMTVTSGTTVQATGGTGGNQGSAAQPSATGAAGGTGSNGDVNLSGGGGMCGVNASSPVGGVGGNSVWGGGGRGGNTSAGAAGSAYGAGGGGGSNPSGTATNINGGAGVAGVVVVEEFY